jgi:D-alanyl-D-alanine carboxypeptidase
MPGIYEMTALRGHVFATARLNIRADIPGTLARIVRTVSPGTQLTVLGAVNGEVVAGNGRWYAGEDKTFFWSGGCERFREDRGDDGIQVLVRRRSDGTIAPLTEPQVRDVFGTLPYKEGKEGRIVIDKKWVEKNIVDLETPTLEEEGFPRIRVHRKSAEPFKRVFDAIEARGLANRILTCAGTFVPRHKGWTPSRGLSSHSWGIAIDLNVAWNPYGRPPADLNERGSLRELVPLFEAEGFAWGGYFSSPYEDGMHFELARIDLE